VLEDIRTGPAAPRARRRPGPGPAAAAAAAPLSSALPSGLPPSLAQFVAATAGDGGGSRLEGLEGCGEAAKVAAQAGAVAETEWALETDPVVRFHVALACAAVEDLLEAQLARS
jgi:hypothetical protein